MQEQILVPKLSDYEKTFFHSKWRPALAWSYLFVILMDFVFLPIIVISLGADANTFNWEPLTLKGSGIYHVSMLTIVGVTAYGRTKEKLERNLTIYFTSRKHTFSSSELRNRINESHQ